MSTRTFDRRRTARWAACGFAAGASLAAAAPSRAASKTECVDAYSQGQDARDKRQLLDAREAFLTCAQSSCPPLVQADCARFGDEIDRLVPSVTFAARGAGAADLQDTAVYVDGELVASRLNEGKTYDFDPGEHRIRFVRPEHETTLVVVLNEGEKVRPIVALFAPVARDAHALAVTSTASRSVLPWVVAGIGAAAMLTGGVLTIGGLRGVPSDCSLSSHQCESPPGAPSFSEAHAAVTDANVGLGLVGGGAALVAAGLVWHWLEAPSPPKEVSAHPAVRPWVGLGSGGIEITAPL